MDRTLKLETNSGTNNMKEFIVKIPKICRDNDWSNAIGSFQKELDNLPITKKIIFDFTLCRWIDPLPLLSLLIEIVRVKKREVDVYALFPNADNGEEKPSERQIYQKSPNRFLLFMAKEGFLNELFNNGISVKIGKDKLVQVDEDKLLLSQNYKELLFKDIKGTPLLCRLLLYSRKTL